MTAPTNPFAAPQGEAAPPEGAVPPQFAQPPMGWMPPPAPKKAGAGKVVGLTVLGLIVFGGCVSAISGGEDADKVATSSTSTDVPAEESAVVDPAQAAADKAAADKAAADKAAADKVAADKAAAEKAAKEKAAADEAAAEKAAEAAKGTPSQQQAYNAAIDYLDFKAFSRAGLIGQLSSEYGSQFPAADAEFAVARLEREGEVDWNEQAAKAAQEYLDFTSFSRQGLIDQLMSEHGSQFTREQAEYGVNQTGL